jgi:RNA polymerase sigma-70 factor (ECF subfamily)
MNESETEKMISASAEGSDEAFSELVGFYLKPVFNFVYRMSGNAKDAEDITQEVFIKLWKNLKKYESGKNFKAWLFSIARNTAIDRLRKRKNINFSEFENEDSENYLIDSIVDAEPWPDELVIKAENFKMIEEFVDKLSVAYKEVIILRYKNQFTFEEIGKIIKKSTNTVKSQHRRALMALKKLLDATN